MNVPIEAPQENWEEVYWLAVEIIQSRYKSVPRPLIAKIAEAVTAEPIPSDQSKNDVLSNRIAAQLRTMPEPRAMSAKQLSRSRRAPRKVAAAVPSLLRPQRVGSITIVRFSHRDSQGHNFWLAISDCQKNEPHPRLKRVRQDHFLRGRVTSCGCRRMRLMRGNKRAWKQCGRTSSVENQQQIENKLLTTRAAEKNLVLARPPFSGPPACEHGFKLITLELARGDGKARYCELCGLMNDMPAASSPNWARRLAHENLAMTRGMAPSTDSPTSPKAREFSKTADKVWAAGKNNVFLGGSGELEITAAVRAQAIVGRRRSASGRDKIRPWQNPNVEFDQSADAADTRLANHYEPGDRDLDQGKIDRRVAKKPENLLDEQSRGLDDCYGDRDEKALLKYELGEKRLDEDAAEATADDGEDLKGDDSDKPSCDD